MPAYAYVILVVGWVCWFTPFFLIKRTGEKAMKLDTRSRWGIVLQAVAYSLLWQNPFWLHRPEAWRVALPVVFLALGCVLSWTASRALGRQWRVDAGLNAEHELVRRGPYRLVRHPIYASMLCLLLGTGFMVTPLWILAIALVIFVIGTEIRVRIEDALLESRFGEDFRQYQRSAGAYVPFVK